MCFTPIPEVEMVKIVINVPDYNIKKKLVNQQFLDIAQLGEKVRQIKQLRDEKEIIRKVIRRERVAYLNYVDSKEKDDDQKAFVAKLQLGPLYVCAS